MTYFIIKHYGIDRLVFSLRSKAYRWRHTRPAMGRIADEMLRIEGALFDSQGRRGGGSWRRDLPATLERKLFHDRDPRIMHDRLRLRESLTRRESPDNILDITESTIRFGTLVPYAEAHQEGKGGMPKREIIRFTPRDHRKFAEILADHVMGRR